MRSPLPAFQAFSRDAQDTTRPLEEPDSRLAGWLAVTKAAEHLSSMRREKRDLFLSSIAPTVLPPTTTRPTLRHDVLAAPTEPIARWAERLRVEAEAMERAGCFEMAFATVSAVCRLTKDADVVSQLTATAHLGRIARQLGDAEMASDCYQNVVSEATRVRDGPLSVLGLLGLGNLARNRGNRPEERRLFSLARSLAHPGGTCERSAQQGLMIAAMSDDRLPEALEHGWRAVDLSDEGSDERAMALSNLAFAALKGGFPGAALSGFQHVLSITTVPRIRIVAIGGAMRAAARRRDHGAVASLGALGEREAAVTNAPFEIATFSLGAGLARQTTCEWGAATVLLTRTREIAVAHAYHELQMRADEALRQVEAGQLAAELPAPGVDEQDRSGMVPAGIRRLEALAV